MDASYNGCISFLQSKKLTAQKWQGGRSKNPGGFLDRRTPQEFARARDRSGILLPPGQKIQADSPVSGAERRKCAQKRKMKIPVCFILYRAILGLTRTETAGILYKLY
jgi:hypothetical protein